MWSGRDKIWSRYNKEVMAADAVTAGFLTRYIHNMRIKREYLSAIEVIDLQRYKIYKDNRSVKRCLNERLKTPFIFVHNKN